jgi:hypothetical protein
VVGLFGAGGRPGSLAVVCGTSAGWCSCAELVFVVWTARPELEGKAVVLVSESRCSWMQIRPPVLVDWVLLLSNDEMLNIVMWGDGEWSPWGSSRCKSLAPSDGEDSAVASGCFVLKRLVVSRVSKVPRRVSRCLPRC